MTSTAVDQPIRGNKMAGRQKIHDMPRVSVYRNAGITPASATAYIVQWDTVEYDVEGMWNAANPTRLTCISAGLWRVTGWGQWAPDATVTRRLLIAKTAAGVVTSYPGPGVVGAEIPAVGAGLTTSQSNSYEIPMNAGDYVEMVVTQFTAGAIAWNAATAVSRVNGFQACMIST